MCVASVLAAIGSTPAQSTYQVSGLIVDSRTHAPLAHARVTLAPITAREAKTAVVTNRGGRFSFAVRQPGKYSLQMSKPGYPLQSYKQAAFSGLATAIVAGDGQDTGSIIFEAKRGGVISGRVKDEASEPVGNALIAVFQSAVVGGLRRIVPRGQTRANALGEFRLASLPRGAYYVCAMGRPWFADSVAQFEQIHAALAHVSARNAQAGAPTTPARLIGDAVDQPDSPPPAFSADPNFRGTAFLTTYYPSASTVEEASAVQVDIGGETDISITLPFARAVSIKGTISIPGEIGDGRAYLYKKVYDRRMLFLDEWVRKGGAFQFKNVPAGPYEIVAASQSGSGESSWTVRQDIIVGDSDMEVTLRPDRLGSLSGRVVFQRERPDSTGDLFVTLRNPKGAGMPTAIGADGKFSFNRLPPDRYELTAGNNDYIAVHLTGPAGEDEPPEITISSGEMVERTVMLARAAAVLEGTVENSQHPVAGIFVLLIPKDASPLTYRFDQSDGDGTFKLATIPAGDYYLIALSDGEGVAYRQTDVNAILSKAAMPVHINAGDRLNVKLHVTDVAALNLPVR